jgi:hypothetical protein
MFVDLYYGGDKMIIHTCSTHNYTGSQPCVSCLVIKDLIKSIPDSDVPSESKERSKGSKQILDYIIDDITVMNNTQLCKVYKAVRKIRAGSK